MTGSSNNQGSSRPVDRCINHLKHWRGIAICYEKTATIYVAPSLETWRTPLEVAEVRLVRRDGVMRYPAVAASSSWRHPLSLRPAGRTVLDLCPIGSQVSPRALGT
jgi:hypothetical protein